MDDGRFSYFIRVLVFCLLFVFNDQFLDDTVSWATSRFTRNREAIIEGMAIFLLNT